MANSIFHHIFFLSILLAASPIFAQSSSDEYGTASFYGNEFQGRKTASGEKYDKNALTCAHRTLKFGTKVRVTRLDNKKSVVVKVNDRGPFIKGYIVDLSRAAAEDLDMIRDGVVKVKLEVLTEKEAAPKPETRLASGEMETEKPTAEKTKVPEKTPPAETEKSRLASGETEKSAKKAEAAAEKLESAKPKLVTSGDFETFGLYQIELSKPAQTGFGVQVITYSDFDNVFKEVAKLQKNWGGKVLVSTAPPLPGSDQMIYKIILGPFSDEKTASKNRKSAAKKGYSKCFVVNLEEVK